MPGDDSASGGKLLPNIIPIGECNGMIGVFPANRCRILDAIEIGQEVELDQAPRELVNPPCESFQERPGQAPDLTKPTHIGTVDLANTSAYPYGNNSVSQYDDYSNEQHQNQQHLFSSTSSITANQPSTIQSIASDHEGASHIQSPPPEPADGSDSDEVVLPPNWTATTNSKGRLYYYNIITKETSWKLPSMQNIPQIPSDTFEYQHLDHQMEILDQDHETVEDEQLPEGWNIAQDEDGSQYFFNTSTGETTWDRPTSPEVQRNQFQSPRPSESSDRHLESSPLSSTQDKFHGSISPTVSRTTPKRQSSADENMLQSQLLGLSLSEEELHALQLNQLPVENIQRKGSLRVKSQKVVTNATISSWKDYWVVVYKGFLLFYRDDNGAIKNAHSLKASTESLYKLRQATQVKPSGCFDVERVSVELPTNGQALTKKKNYFFITPGASVRLLLQDPSGGDERAWVKDIEASLASRKADEQSSIEDSYVIQVLKRQTSGECETSSLKMNKKIEEKDLKTSKNPLKMDKRGIRSMVTHGIHVPRRKSAQDERLRLPEGEETFVEPTYGDQYQQQHQHQQQARPAVSHRSFSDSKRKNNRESPKDQELGHDGAVDIHQDVSSLGSVSIGSHGSYGAKAKLTNMSRNFFSKDKDKEKEKEKEKEKVKDKSKDKIKDKSKDKDVRKESTVFRPPQVFGGSLTVGPGRKVPRIVELCVNAIEARGFSTAGIYRVSGHMASIQNLKRAFNEGGNDVERLIEKEPDVNTIAALLKLYFRELREPVMLFDFYPSFIAAADITDYNEKLYTIKSLVHSLPEANFNTLQYLMLHLSRVQDQYATTKMDSANLAICFAPNLLRQEVNDLTSIINTGKQSSIIDTLIEQQEWVFDPYPEEDDDVGDDHAVSGGGGRGEQEGQVLQGSAAELSMRESDVDQGYEVVAEYRETDNEEDKEGRLTQDESYLDLQQQFKQELRDENSQQVEQEFRQDQDYFVVDTKDQRYEQQQHRPHHHTQNHSPRSQTLPVTTMAPASFNTTTTTTAAAAATTTTTPVSAQTLYSSQPPL
ncbi:hypothetical protein FBU30_009602 [Linnemannia zychae]|nr:hypothetical protein FBU30_009602 [Linnemannia zychae]